MKKYLFNITLAAAMILSLSACGDDFLNTQPSEKIEAGQPATLHLINQNVTSVYQILLLDSYANWNYNSYVLMSDLRSDDLFKGGGEANDQAGLYFLSQFRNSPTDVPSGWWSIYYAGLARANNAITACETPVGISTAEEANTVKRLSAEAHALRGYYLYSLWIMWGNIPYFTHPLPYPYMTKQYKADEIYKFIMQDFDAALAGDALPTIPTEAGRVTKHVAQMMRARAVMYQNDQSRYNQVLADMVEIANNPAFDLMNTLDEVFVREGEFCKESIFETNQKSEGKSWGDPWIGFGTCLPILISPLDLKDVPGFIGGWGFAPVREEAYNMYATDDMRRGWSINDFRGASYAKRFQDTGFFMRKYAARTGYNNVTSGDRDLNFENNLRIFRLPEAYLNAAELLVKGASAPGAQTAQYYVDLVRKRAFGDKFEQNKVPATFDNIKKERRLEFLGEGIRYWDLVRWGDAATVLSEDIPKFSSKRTWNPATNKYLPIPQGEIDKTKGMGEFELVQNPY